MQGFHPLQPHQFFVKNWTKNFYVIVFYSLKSFIKNFNYALLRRLSICFTVSSKLFRFTTTSTAHSPISMGIQKGTSAIISTA